MSVKAHGTRYLPLLGLMAVLSQPSLLGAQDLAPRAYVITPIHSNGITLTWSYSDGSINFNGAIPVSDTSGKYSNPVFSYYHSFSLFGRSANIVAAVPYGRGNFEGTAAGTDQQVYRSGLADSVYRFSVNLKGGPAMAPKEMINWKQKVLLGVGLKVIAPTGQYDPTRVINWGGNRWSVRPEFGYSQRWSNWVVDGYAGVWLTTTNHQYYPSTSSLSQKPIAAFESHVSYDFKPRLWFSFDGNFWIGGKTSVDGVEDSLTKQQNSRLGATASIPLTRHQSLKFGYSNGAYVRFGGNFQNVSAAWQYSWLGRPN